VTVRAMTQGLMMGRDFGLGIDSGFGAEGGGAGGATAGAVPMGGSKTAWLANLTDPFPCLDGQMGVAASQIYMTTVLYIE